MDELLKLALMFVMEARGRPRGGSATRMTAGALCSGFAIVSVIAGIACGVAALWMYLIPIIGGAGAALASAGVFFLLSGTLMFVARNMFSPPLEAVVDDEVEPIADEIADLLRDGFLRHKGASLLAAVVAGLAAGSHKAPAE